MNRAAVWLIICVSLLFSIGLLMVFNTTSAEIIDRSLDISTHGALFKQITYGLIGLGVGLLIYSYGHQWLLRWSTPMLIACTVLLILVFVPRIGQTINGAHRWIGIGGFTFQPSECVKILIPLVFIRWVLQQTEPIEFKPFLKALGLLSIPIGLILLEPDNGTTLIIFACLVVLFLLTRIRWVYWALPLIALLSVGVIAASQMPHVHDRIHIYLHPELDIRGKGHQPHQAKIAAGSGQLMGLGLGQSLQKLNYLPEARSDYIAAIYAEECGFVGILALIALYMTFTFAGFFIALRAQDRGSFMIAAILTFLISIQAFVNLGVVSGLLPSKGMTLPFFSQGGSSLIMNIAALFVLLDIARHPKKLSETL
ncbi:MAG: spoVE [Parachlamydiales bacterium]|nr:spoVE [Parachlamydiales bacterium]